MVAFGSFLTVMTDDDSQYRLPLHGASGFQYMYASANVDVIDVHDILAPAHAMPVFSDLEDSKQGPVTRDHVMECGESRCRY